MEFDVFISHASEDKAAFVAPLAKLLTDLGVRVWYDEFTLKVGDSLSRSIDKGLANSQYGVVVLSKAFLSKPWPEYELRGLTSIELERGKSILPIWHGVSKNDVLKFSPPLADKLAVDTSQKNINEITLEITKVVRPDIYNNLIRWILWQAKIHHAKRGYKKLSELRPGPIRHDILPDSFLTRLQLIHTILSEHLNMPLDEFLDGFKRDLHPEKEIQIWEKIALIYLKTTQEQTMNTEQRSNLYIDLLRLSLGMTPATSAGTDILTTG